LKRLYRYLYQRHAAILICVCLCGGSSFGQTAAAAQAPSTAELWKMVQDLQQRVGSMETELTQARALAAQSQAENAELRRQLSPLKARDERAPNGLVGGMNASVRSEPSAKSVPVEEELDLLNSKIDVQNQVKVESQSKYSVHLSGMVLLNAFSSRGNPDNMENPALASEIQNGDPKGSVGGSLRQTQLGLEVFGPKMRGAKTSGNVQFDFAGGLSSTTNGATLGILRLRTAVVRLDWDKTSIVAGQDSLFFSPVSPTSFASVEQPPLAYAGNLWGWIPQVRVERTIPIWSHSKLLLQAGVLDPISAQEPDGGVRTVSVGERARRPAFGTRLAWSKPLFGQTLTIGTGHYQSKQDWNNIQTVGTVNAWMQSLDWDIPLSHRLSLSGEFHRGRAIADIGGGLGQNVAVFLSNPAPDDSLPTVAPTAETVKGLNTIGGWGQLKIRVVSRLEFNTAFGEENPFRAEIAAAANTQSYLADELARNRAFFSNIIFRPRSNLLMTAEYRHIRSYIVDEQSKSADHVNLGVGILF
jgi:hypothetical protein